MNRFSKLKAAANLPQFVALAVIATCLLASRSATPSSHAGDAGLPVALAAAAESSAATVRAASSEPLHMPAGYRWLEPAEASYVVYDVWGEYSLPEPVNGLIVPVGMELDSDEAWGLVLTTAPRALPSGAREAPAARGPRRYLPSSAGQPGIEAEWTVDLQQRSEQFVDYRAVVTASSGPLLIASRIPLHRLAEVRSATEALATVSSLADSTGEEPLL